MDPNRSAAWIMAASARATARVNGMLAENSVRWRAGAPIAYGHEDFVAVIEQEGISREAVLAIFTHGTMNQEPLAGSAVSRTTAATADSDGQHSSSSAASS